MVDPALQGLYPSKSLSRFADAIALCVQVKNRLQLMQLSHCHCHPNRCRTFLTLLKRYLDAARAGVPAADVGGRAVAGAARAEGGHGEDAREPPAAPRRVRRGLRVLSEAEL